MRYNKIENTGMSISALTLGTWVFGGDSWGGAQEQECLDAVSAALDHGINMIDTAPVYGYGISEKIIGKAIRGKRDKVIIATKCGLIGRGAGMKPDLSPESIFREIEESLERLKTDYVDIYQCHWPDPETPVEKTIDALLKLKDQGKIRHIGVSNFPADLLQKTAEMTAVATAQYQYSMLARSIENDVLPFCVEKGIGVLTYGPLAGGILTGKYQTPPKFKKSDAREFFYKYYSGDAFQRTQRLLEALRALHKPLNQTAINWVRRQKGITSVIVGCRNARQVEDNVNALQWDLSQNDVTAIDKALSGLEANNSR